MATTTHGESRIIWLDGLRGLAALQVVLLHYASAFLPGLGLLDPARLHYGWEAWVAATPLFALLNGYTAVSLFFLLSGVALTLSFAHRPFAMPHAVLRRVLRLGLPMAVATLLAALLFRLWPDAHTSAAFLTGSSGWLDTVAPGTRPTPAGTLHQILLEGMVYGFGDTSVWPTTWLTPLGLETMWHALDAPLWTLNIEFAGSLLVMLLVALQAAAPRGLYRLLCAAFILLFITSPLALFAVGHLAAPLLARFRSRAAGAVLLIAGLVLCTGQMQSPLDPWLALLPAPPFGVGSDPFHLRYSLAALAIFYGVALLPAVQAVLRRPVACWLGRISFSLYLLHFPVLFTAVSTLFVLLRPHLRYGEAAAICTVTGIALTLAAAALFHRLIDRPAIRLSRSVGESTKVNVITYHSAPR